MFLLPKYILDNHGNPVFEENLFIWAEWFEHSNRLVERTEMPDDIVVSTMFLAVDHNHQSHGAINHVPILYETMIFGGHNNGYCARYSTKEEAIIGHQIAVDMAQPKLLN